MRTRILRVASLAGLSVLLASVPSHGQPPAPRPPLPAGVMGSFSQMLNQAINTTMRQERGAIWEFRHGDTTPLIEGTVIWESVPADFPIRTSPEAQRFDPLPTPPPPGAQPPSPPAPRPPGPGGGGAGGGSGFSSLIDQGGPNLAPATSPSIIPALPSLQPRAPSAFDSFLNSGSTLTVAELLDIYQGYDPFDPVQTAGSHAGQSLSAAGTGPSTVTITPSSAGTSPSSAGTSMSSAGNSPSSVGWSLSSAGTSLSSVGTSLDFGWGGGMSLAGSPTMSFAGGPLDLTPASATTVNLHSASNGLFQDVAWNRANGGYGVIRDPFGQLGAFSPGGRLAGFTHGLSQDEILRTLRTSGVEGLSRLLAQPFNVLMTWGPGAYDLDLHMTGPSGTNDGTRFHIYFSQRGSQTTFPFAELIKDCICTSGSEVILVSRLLQGGVYRISAFNFGNQSTTSTQLTTNADLQMMIVRGGVAVSVGNGTTIQGGTVVFRGSPTPGRPGNTWLGVEIDPRTGQIRFVDQANNSGGGDGPANAAAARAASIQPLAAVLPLRGGRVSEQ